ncbi:MAG: glycosyltransferase family 2 protein [Solidesulfovibrio sp.]
MTEYYRKIAPDVSIVIVTYNNKNCIEACLTSIYDSFPTTKVEIVVVDNCSVDKGVALIPILNQICNNSRTDWGGAAWQGKRAVGKSWRRPRRVRRKPKP